MIDIGITQKKLKEKINPNFIQIAFISHKHSDHVNLATLRYLMTKDLSVDPDTGQILGEPTITFHIPLAVKAMLEKEDKLSVGSQKIPISAYEAWFSNIIYHENLPANRKQKYGIYEWTFVPQKHHDLINYALIIRDKKTELLYATDLDTLDASSVGAGLNHLGKFDIILLEGNYDQVWLDKYIEQTLMVVAPELAETGDEAAIKHFLKEHGSTIPKDIRNNLYRALQNRRHLSKQDARIYVAKHLKEGGRYYEIHRSSMFYEEPDNYMEHLLERLSQS